ncbi:Daunorubicin/doxorubicin resistance ATP-binding protein DrrA [Actinomyces bovis]|uniref:Daunorubicin/doxorubicin resistance ATP-binding protein DrrA n=1 Tax=Actinomyces bovis TaxID=1658 RepID=A0ABY1VM80_9ACTO|nr:ABC transporter ATP-binding protein [Actinomyces bovis]SPT52787.1 Daunorubicin/doxorubicin resistance ATP-binding protein DrrA [Actinomyces bovis]VEG54817.1 Daunorubicin/doxorubicin resistance ATP-binding protein DrrA [Actinomyces israelii]
MNQKKELVAPDVDAQIAIEALDLHKAYGLTRALDGLSLNINSGTITALLGPNGAGKTTFMETICGMRAPDSGSIRVFGLDPVRHHRDLALILGVQVQEFSLQATVKVRESLTFFASLYPNPILVDEALHRFGLAEKADVRFPRLSGGQKRRLSIARALIGNPSVVVLDEPTAGLDPQGQEFLRDEIRRLRDEGRTVVLSTHDVDEAEELADEIVIIDRGTVIAQGTAQSIRSRSGYGHRLLIRTTSPQQLADYLAPSPSLPRVDSVVVFTDTPEELRRQLEGRAKVIDERPASLEDIFLILTGRGLRE